MKLFRSKVVKNAGWIIGAQVLKTVLGLVISLFTARFLGPSNFGVINYAASIVAFVAPIMYLGFNNTLVQEIISHPDEEGKVMGSAILLSFISSLCCIVGIVVFTAIADKDEPITILVCGLYSLILVFQSVDLINYWFQAKLMSKHSSLVSLIAYVLVSGYRIFLLATGKSVVWFSVASALDVFLIAVSLLWLYRRQCKQELLPSLSFAFEMLSRSKYYILSNLMIAVFAQTDRIMLKQLIDSSAVAFYTAASTCAGIAGMVFSAIIDSMRPVILEQKHRDEAAYERSMIGLYSVIIYLSLFYSAVVTGFAPIIVGVLYGDAYSASIPVLQVIVWYGTASFLGGARDIWILAEKKQKHLLVINILGVIVNIGLNMLLIPKYSALGAAIATVITQIVINILFVSIYKPTRHNGYLMFKALNPKSIIKMRV